MPIQRFEEREGLDLVETRNRIGLTQAEMAKRMGMGLRAYQELESSPERVKLRHQMLAGLAALYVALERGDPMLAPASIRRHALDLAALIRGIRES